MSINKSINLKSYKRFENKKITQIMKKDFIEKYPDFESFEKDFCRKIEISLEQVKTGQARPIEELFKQMEEWTGIYE